MALEAHVLLDNSDDAVPFHKLGEAMAHLNAASFAGIGGVLVVGVGATQQLACDRVVDFTGVDPTDSAT